jgi:hypothetical protein
MKVDALLIMEPTSAHAGRSGVDTRFFHITNHRDVLTLRQY